MDLLHPAPDGRRPLGVTIVLPVYNDWDAGDRLLHDLDRTLAAAGVTAGVLVVDDASHQRYDGRWRQAGFSAIRRIEVVRLACNLGHQRAIAIGLTAAAADDAAHVMVMDADGEDRAEDAARLLAVAAQSADSIVCGQRRRRSEGPGFRLFYRAYKLLFRLLTGATIDFGNFCIVPRQQLRELIHNSNVWSNLAGAIMRSRMPVVRVPVDRGERFAGRSTMGFIGLIVHGLSAVAVYSDVALARLLVFAAALGGVTVVGALVALAIRLFTDLAIPGWASTVVGTLAVIFTQSVLLSVIAIFLLLSSRGALTVIPARDALSFAVDRQIAYEGARQTAGRA